MTTPTAPNDDSSNSCNTDAVDAPVPFSERARLVRRVARQRATSGMMRIRNAASKRLAEIALEHEQEIAVTRSKLRAGLRRAYAMTGMSAVFSALLVGAAVTAAQPRLIDDALVGLSTALPEPVAETPSWIAPSSGEAEPEVRDEPPTPAARRTVPGKTVATQAPPKKPSPVVPSPVFTCSDDEYDPLNSCLL